MTSKTQKPKKTKVQSAEPWVVNALYWVICGSVLGISLIVSVNGRDAFRLPKDILFRGESIIVAGLTIIGLLLGQLTPRKPNWKNPLVFMPLLIVLWTLVTTIASTNRALSWPSLGYCVGAAAVFLTTVSLARIHGLRMLRWLLWGGVLNSLLYLLQAFGKWNPFPFVTPYWLSTSPAQGPPPPASTAFLGNENDIGNYLVPVFVVSLALGIAGKRNRLLHFAIATLLGTTLTAVGGLAATGAILAATTAMSLLALRKTTYRLGWLLIVALCAILLFQTYRAVGPETNAKTVLGSKAVQLVVATKTGDLDGLLRSRLVPFKTAIEMFKDHPVTGVGPGVFGWQYYPYKIQVVERDPNSRTETNLGQVHLGSFTEVHNDHLEVMAETGLPGLLLFLASLSLLPMMGLRKAANSAELDIEQRAARLTLFPLAAGIVTLATFQYPLQLSSSLSSLLFISAVYGGVIQRRQTSLFRAHSIQSIHLAANWKETRWALAGVIAGATLISTYFWCARPWVCNIISNQLEAALFMSSSGDKLAADMLRTNLDKSLQCLDCLPKDENLPVVAATTYRLMSQDNDALNIYDNALKLQRRPEYYYNRAVTKLEVGDTTGALEDYVTAARFSPRILANINDATLRMAVATRAGSVSSE